MVRQGAPASDLRTEVRVVDDERRRLERLVDSTGDGILEGGPGGAILSANAAACRMFGRSEEDLRAIGRDGIVDPQDPRVRRAVHSRERTGAFKGEMRFVRAHGTTFTGDVSSSIYTDHQGNERTRLIVRDVSAREEAAEALLASEERYRSVVAASREGLIPQARDGRILAWNDAAVRIVGVPAEAVIGRSATRHDWQTIREDGSDWPASEHPSMQTLADGEAQDDVLTGLRRDGSEHVLHTEFSVDLDPLGAPAALTGHYRDVTELRRAEETIRRLGAELRPERPDGEGEGV
jgi:PAS domain S-box-containing protein